MNTKAKDFFMHLGAMVTLYAGVIALLNLLFRVINVSFPQVERYYFGGGSISLPVATLIVVFPIFLILMNLIRRGYEADPSRKEFAVRKWLIWITLFVTGIVIAGDLITLLYFFLDGRELTTGFILKVLSVLVVAGGVFGYYVDDLRDALTSGRRNLWRIFAGVLVIGAIIIGFSVIGSPRTQRLMNYDVQKVNDLQNIQSQLISYWQSKEILPETLEGLSDPVSSYYVSIPKDLQTGASYTYNKTGDMSFELCAEFNLASGTKSEVSRISNVYYYGIEPEQWEHGEGYFCFERTIDPDFYPPIMKGR